jgi:hypothetical protein
MERELQALETRKEAALAASQRLRRFVVERSEFEVRSTGFERRPSIELTIRNGLDEAVARAFFHARLINPDGGQLLVEEDFDYQIPGGIDPGEVESWRLSPDRRGPWGEAPRGARLEVTVRRVDAHDGQPLFGGATWDPKDQRRLEELRESLASDDH